MGTNDHVQEGVKMQSPTTNEKILESLLKRDSKERHVTVEKLIAANDALVTMVTRLKLELDEYTNKLETESERARIYQRRICELEVLLKEKDRMIINGPQRGI